MTSQRDSNLAADPVQRRVGSGPTWGMVVVARKVRTAAVAAEGWNSHRNYALNLPMRGRGTLRTPARREFKLQPNSFYQHFPHELNQRIRWEEGELIDEWYLVLDPRLYRRLSQLGLIPSKPVADLPPDHEAADRFEELYSLLSDTAEEPGNYPRILAAVVSFLSYFTQTAGSRSSDAWTEPVGSIQTWLDAHPASRKPLPELARQHGVSYASLRTHFKERVGLSLSDYRIQRRIESAQTQLSHASIAVTAETLGYPDPFTFSTQFKKVTGFSPRDFQRQFCQDRF